MVGQLVLVEIDIGAVSVRVCAMFLLTGYAFLHLRRDIQSHGRLRQLRTIIVIWAMFLVWIALCDWSNGIIAGFGTRVAYLKSFVSTRVMPVLYLITMVTFLRTTHQVNFIAFVLLSIVLVSSGCAVLQYLNVGFAHRVHEVLTPHTWRSFETMLGRELDSGDLAVAGLAGYSIDFSYHVLSYGMFLLALSLLKPDQRRQTLITLAAFSAMAVSLILCKSRSGAVGAGLCLVCGALIAPKLYRGVTYKGFLLGAAVVVLAITMLTSLVDDSHTTSAGATNLARMRDFRDDGRLQRATAALQEIAKRPVFGMGVASFERLYEYTPHNTLLNAGIYAGIPGIILCVMFHWTIYRLYRNFGSGRQLTGASWCTLGSILGMLAYVWNGMFHNGSFVTGGIHLFILLGVFVAARNCELRGQPTRAHGTTIRPVRSKERFTPALKRGLAHPPSPLRRVASANAGRRPSPSQDSR
jgi:hypothetical protein